MSVQHSKQRVKADRGCAKRDSGQQVRHISANRSSCRVQLHVTTATEFQRIPNLPDRLRIVSADMTDLLSRISLRTASISFDSLFAVLDVHQEACTSLKQVKAPRFARRTFHAHRIYFILAKIMRQKYDSDILILRFET